MMNLMHKRQFTPHYLKTQIFFLSSHVEKTHAGCSRCECILYTLKFLDVTYNICGIRRGIIP